MLHGVCVYVMYVLSKIYTLHMHVGVFYRNGQKPFEIKSTMLQLTQTMMLRHSTKHLSSYSYLPKQHSLTVSSIIIIAKLYWLKIFYQKTKNLFV